MYSLQHRRGCYIIIHMWKISRGHAPNNLELQFHSHPRLGEQYGIKSLISFNKKLGKTSKIQKVLGHFIQIYS